MKKHWQGPRRDMCYFVGRRGVRLTPPQAALAWHFLAQVMQDDLSERDVPKFRDLITLIRAATIFAKSRTPQSGQTLSASSS